MLAMIGTGVLYFSFALLIDIVQQRKFKRIDHNFFGERIFTLPPDDDVKREEEFVVKS
jgi:hypothetical protein